MPITLFKVISAEEAVPFVAHITKIRAGDRSESGGEE